MRNGQEFDWDMFHERSGFKGKAKELRDTPETRF